MPSGEFRSLATRLGISRYIRWVEDWWFDTTRSVKTTGEMASFQPSMIVGEIRDSFTYMPTRAATARAAIRELPILDYSNYTFIDIGSGKGRLLFVAAEQPFRKVLGIEVSLDLHQLACGNILRHNHRQQRCFDIESVHANAADYVFPDGNLVVCMFNPFGPEVLSRMLANLAKSIEKHSRHVLILMIWPEQADLVARMEAVSLYKKTHRHHIYQTVQKGK